MAETTHVIPLHPEGWSDDPNAAIAQLRAADFAQIVVDCSGVTFIPALVAQILLSAIRTAADEGAKLRLTGISPDAQSSLEEIGLWPLDAEVSA